MNDSQISVRYAKALFLSAKEENVLEEVLRDMKLIRSSVEVKGFKEYIESPVARLSSKQKLIHDVYGTLISELSLRFYDLILTNKRENHLMDIIRNFISLYREEKGIKSAKLKLPFQISEDSRKKFLDLLGNIYKTHIEMEEELNPDLIGGFILTVEDQQFDASIKTSLAKIKKNLLQTAIEN